MTQSEQRSKWKMVWTGAKNLKAFVVIEWETSSKETGKRGNSTKKVSNGTVPAIPEVQQKKTMGQLLSSTVPT